MGRPSIYSDELGDFICSRMIEGASLHSICQRPEMPHYSTAMAWKADPEHPFSPKYARARDDRGTYWGEKVAEIAMLTLQGKYDPQAARVAIDGIKWTAGRMNPREFGDRMEVQGNINATVGVLAVPVTQQSVQEWMALDPGAGRNAALPEPREDDVREVDPRVSPPGIVRV